MKIVPINIFLWFKNIVHDQSKFENPEKDPYVFITWKYKCKDEGWDFEECNPPKDIDDQMFEATYHHCINNSHHPEFHSPDKNIENLFNKENRDKPPKKIVDATKMPDLDISEMCADWSGVSDERGGDPRKWAKDNIGVRWKFTKEQEGLIYKILDKIWEE
jgi:hypothetical protein